MMEAVNNPEDPSAGTRQIPFTRELYIEQTDFMEDPPKKFFRLGLAEKSAYVTVSSSPVMTLSKMPKGKLLNCDALMTLKLVVDRLLMGVRSKGQSIGYPPNTLWMRKSVSTTTYSKLKIQAM